MIARVRIPQASRVCHDRAASLAFKTESLKSCVFYIHTSKTKLQQHTSVNIDRHRTSFSEVRKTRSIKSR